MQQRSVWLCLASLLFACASDAPASDDVELARVGDFDSFAASLPYDDTNGTYLVEGDIGLDEAALRRWHAEYVNPTALVTVNDSATIHAPGTLSFCVSPEFGIARAQEVRQALLTAGKEWEAVTGVKFVWNWLADLSCDASNTRVWFDVRPAPAGANYRAKAYWPWNDRPARTLFLSNAAWDGRFSIASVARHEIGHMLGFRHEHARPESGAQAGDCVGTSGNLAPLTRFDSASVMRYPWCNNMAPGDLVLTKWDKRGARCHYFGECEWERMPGAAQDIAIDASGVVYVLGTNWLADGYEIFRWNGSSWSGLGVGAISIATADRTLYRVKNNNEIWMLSSIGWWPLPGRAVRIAGGADGSLWCLGTATVDGGHQVFRWTHGDFRYENQGALSVAVDPAGMAWITNDRGEIKHSYGSGALWQFYPGIASSVGIGAGGHTFKLAYGDGQWNWYGYFIDDLDRTNAVWQRLTGQAMRVAVDPIGVPWIVDNAKGIYRNRWKREDWGGN